MQSASSPPSGITAWPPSFLACLPFLWSRVLFPGFAPRVKFLCWRSLVLLLLLPALGLYPCLSFRLFEPDEGRYAQIPSEMLARSDWIVPRLQGEPYLDKPPLLYWLVMLSYSLLGVHDWSARLVPALALHGCLLLTYLFGRRLLGERVAFWGALMLSLTPGFVGIARLLVPDGVLTFLVLLALFSAFEAVRGPQLHWGWWGLTTLACGLGLLSKGPVILVLLLPPLWLHLCLTGSPIRLHWRALVGLLGGAVVVALPWYAAICWRIPKFAGYFFWQHNVQRFFEPFDHIEPVWFYGPILLGGLFPFVLLLWPLGRWLLAAPPAESEGRTGGLGFLLLAALWCVLFFSLGGCKLPTYILPAFPPLVLALAAVLVRHNWQQRLWARSTIVALYGVMMVCHYLIVPQYAEYRSPMNNPEEVQAWCGDRRVPVVCYPRHVDSVAFYLGRADFRTFRSKATPALIEHLRRQPRTVILFAHRTALERLRTLLPPELRVTRTTRLGLCSMAQIERITVEEISEPPR